MDDWLYPLLRFSHYVLLLGLFGVTAFRSIGLRQTMAHRSDREFSKGLVSAAALAPLVTIALMLVSIAAMMAQSVWQLEWTTIETMVTSTSIGWAFLVRLGLLVTAAALMLAGRSPCAGLLAALLFGLALATLAWSGHAAASEGVWGIWHRLNDALHLLAAGLWIGAMGWFFVLTAKVKKRPDNAASAALLADVHSFAMLGIFLVGIVAITGLINAQLIFGLENGADVLGTDYGQLLAIKVGLVATMLIFAARNSFAGRRYAKAIGTPASGPVATLAQLRTSLAAEIALALAVIGLTAFIGMKSPISH